MTEKLLLMIAFIFGGFFSNAQECPRITNPLNGDEEVPVNVTITWREVTGIDGYLISLGTTPGGTDILNRRSAGPVNSFTPKVGLPEDTLIYVTIELFVPGQQLVRCTGESFRTIDVTKPPPCTRLIEPVANSTNVSVIRDLNWAYSPTATGYLISMGTSAGSSDLVSNFDVGNELMYNPPQDFELDSEVFVTIVPYNENGSAEPCLEESFTTGIPTIDCDAFIDPGTGRIFSIRPQIDFPDRIGFCEGELSKLIISKDTARGFRWFKLNEDGTETLLSESNQIEFDELGRYRYEAYNTINEFGATVECASVKEFDVVRSEPATIESINVGRSVNGLSILVGISGPGAYEFALDSDEGPFQDANSFQNVPIGEHTVFVRDKSGCGVVSRIVERPLSVKDFPRFFTPNGDGINDYWQFTPPPEIEVNVEVIRIYDRYGNFLAQIDPKRIGWDGKFNGRPLPASDYWFKAKSFSQNEIYGHFTLKR